MFKISEFSKISQVSVKTLRYYDQLNLLKPAQTDKFTGYRYYTADQMFQLNRILGYKELGFSLEQIRQMMGEQIPLEEIRGMFRIKQNEIQSNLDKEQARLDRIKARLRDIESEGKKLTSNDVVLKKGESQFIISHRKRASLRQIPSLFRLLDDHLGCTGHSPLSQLVLWRGCEASAELAVWIEQNGYRIQENEPRREICVPHEKLDNPHAYVAEVQIAVERA